MRAALPMPSAQRWLLGAAALVIVIAGLRAAQTLLVPFLLAVFISMISAPALSALHRRGVPAALALLAVLAAVVGFLAVVLAIVHSSVNGFLEALPFYQAQLSTRTATLTRWLSSYGVELAAIPGQLDPGPAIYLIGGLIKAFGAVLASTLLIVLTVIFILLEASSFPRKLVAIAGRGDLLAHLRKFNQTLQHYVAVKTLISLLTGLAVMALLWALGVNHVLLWGLLAFLFNYVPNLGSIVAAVPAVLLALVQLGPGTALMATAGYVVINIGFGNFVEPRYIGRGTGLSPLVVFLSLVFWGWVLGPVGMLLSVPLTVALRIALDSNDDTRWLAVLLGPARPA